jgi:hypothetical protein
MAAAIGNRTGTAVNRSAVWGGAALIGVGGALCSVGAVLWCAAAAGAVRHWVRELDEPPRQTARRLLSQAGAATQAGIEGWQKAGVTRR